MASDVAVPGEVTRYVDAKVSHPFLVAEHAFGARLCFFGEGHDRLRVFEERLTAAGLRR